MPFPVLIVDDNPDDTLLAEMVFRKCKIQNPILVFKSGQECLNYLRNQSERVVALIDLKMRPISGVDLLKIIKSDDLGRRSIFIMLSGLTDVKQINEAYQLGAKTFLVKPLRGEDLIELLTSTLRDEVKVRESSEGNTLRWKH